MAVPEDKAYRRPVAIDGRVRPETDMAAEAAQREPQPGEIFISPDDRVVRVVCTCYCPEMRHVLVITHDLQSAADAAISVNSFCGNTHPFKSYRMVGRSA